MNKHECDYAWLRTWSLVIHDEDSLHISDPIWWNISEIDREGSAFREHGFACKDEACEKFNEILRAGHEGSVEPSCVTLQHNNAEQEWEIIRSATRPGIRTGAPLE